MNKTIRIYRQPGVRDYAKAINRMNDVTGYYGNDNHLVDDVKQGISIVSGLFGGKKYTADQQAFYDRRDQVYDMINRKYGNKHYEKLPGNPFTAFGHDKYKVMGTARLPEFYAMVEQYYPGLLSGQPGAPTTQPSVIKPLTSALDIGLIGTGITPPSSTADKTKQFVEQVVGPATQKDFGGVTAEALENAAIDFVGTLIQKKKNGEQLPGVYDKIASAGIKVEQKLQSKGRDIVEAKVGDFVISNAVIIGGVILLLIFFVFKSKG